MDIKEFYDEKRKAIGRLTRSLIAGELEGHPSLEDAVDPETERPVKVPVAVYVTSVRKREAGTTAGAVSLVTIDNAGYRIADGTHRIATSEEINRHLRHQLEQKRENDATDLKRDAKKMQVVRSDFFNEIPEHLKSTAAAATKEPAGRTGK